jgi:carbamoyl-phosphate synthase large subunit
MSASGGDLRTKVLLTGGGGAGTIAVIHALKELGYEVVTADATVHSAGLRFAHRGFVIPFGADPAFEGAMREMLRSERPAFVVPLVDEEIPVVHRLVAREFPDVRVVAPRLPFCEVTLDKWAMHEQLSAAKISVARSWLASDAADCIYPAVVKPRVGRGSRGLAYLEKPAELAAYLAQASHGADQYVVQERAFGAEYTTSVVVGLDNALLAVVPKEVNSKKGITQVGTTRRSPAIESLCRSIQETLRPHGPFNVQLVLRADGIPVIFEINPRYSTTVALTLAAGVNEVDEVIRHAQGKEPISLQFEPDLVMLRYPTQLYVKESEWSPQDLRPRSRT